MMKKIVLAGVAGYLLGLALSAPAFSQATVPAGGVMGNSTATERTARAETLTAILDRALGSTRGAIIARGASGWMIVAPGTTAFPWVSNGAGADPSYQVLGLGGGGTNATTAAGARTSLGLGTAAVANTGTSGHTIPFLDTANIFSAVQTINLNGTVLPTPFAGTVLQLGNADGTSTKIDLRSFGILPVPGIVTYKSRNTNASPSAVQSGDVLSSWLGGGYGASAYSSFGGIIQMNACENWTNAAQCTEIEFFNYLAGSTTLNSVGKIKQGWILGAATGGDQGIGTANLAGSLFFNGTDWGSLIKTLTNKTINCSNNTCSNIPTTALTGTLQAAQEPAHTGDVTNSAGSVALSLVAGNAGNLNSGTLLAARMPALTGDCTTSAGAVATTCTKINGVDQTAAWTAYTPTVTCGTGPPTTFSVTGSSSRAIGKTIAITISLVITTIGPCVTPLTLTLPVAPLTNGFLVGGENQLNGKVVKIPLNAGSTTTGGLTNYDNTFAPASGTTFILTGIYQAQ